MRPNWSFSYRLDELPYFFTWPLVFLLGFTAISPNQIALLSFLCGIGFLIGMFKGWLQLYPQLLLTLLVLRILLDCADGQLARYTKKTSNLGALYDLAADFTFGILLFCSIGYSLVTIDGTPPQIAISITAIAGFCFLVSSTVFSFIGFLDRHSDLYPAAAKERFIAPLENDHPERPGYSVKLRLLNLIFRYSWRMVSYISFLLVLNPEKSDQHSSALRVLSPLEYGMHLTVLAIILFLKANLAYFLVFEITAFCGLFLLLFYHYR